MKYKGVNAFLSGVRPCVVAMILATGITMALSSLFSYTSTGTTPSPDIRAILVFALLLLIHLACKKLRKAAPSPILMIVLSALLGILFWR